MLICSRMPVDAVMVWCMQISESVMRPKLLFYVTDAVFLVRVNVLKLNMIPGLFAKWSASDSIIDCQTSTSHEALA